jgi:hypothetical protein
MEQGPQVDQDQLNKVGGRGGGGGVWWVGWGGGGAAGWAAAGWALTGTAFLYYRALRSWGLVRSVFVLLLLLPLPAICPCAAPPRCVRPCRTSSNLLCVLPCHPLHMCRVQILSYIDIGKREGARLMCGGKRHGDKGYFVSCLLLRGLLLLVQALLCLLCLCPFHRCVVRQPFHVLCPGLLILVPHPDSPLCVNPLSHPLPLPHPALPAHPLSRSAGEAHRVCQRDRGDALPIFTHLLCPPLPPSCAGGAHRVC